MDQQVDTRITALLTEITTYLQDHQGGIRAGIHSLTDGWDLLDTYAALLPDMPTRLDLQACITSQQEALTTEMQSSSAEGRLETALEMLEAYRYHDDWERSRFLTDIIFATAKEIGPDEEQELASVFMHIVEGIQDESKSRAYKSDCIMDAVRFNNDAVLAALLPDLQPLADAGLSGLYVRPALGCTDGMLGGEERAAVQHFPSGALTP